VIRRATRIARVCAAAGAIVASSCGGGGADRASRAAEQAEAAAAKAKADEQSAAAREADRLAALWSYYDGPAGKGTQRSATIYSSNDIDTDGSGPKRVRLIFRDHPAWGRSSYLVLQAGDFKCPACSVAVSADDAAPKRMSARRPPTEDAIALFINDWREVWKLTTDAKQMRIEFPVKAGGTRTATFEVAGLNPAKMPGW
jgi:hypothetical protein